MGIVNRYDVVIIGAGPAGLYCAGRLSPHLRVALVTNKRIASHKPCGGLLTKQADAYLKEMDIPSTFYYNPAGVDADIFYRDRLIKNSFYNIDRSLMELELYNSFMNTVDLFILRNIGIVKSGGAFFILGEGLIPRSLLRDPLLRRDAFVVTGIKPDHTIHSLQNQHTSEEISCKYLIAADGANSITRRLLGYERAPVIGVEQQICSNRMDCVKMVVDRSITPGYYYWIIPKGERMLVGYKTGHGHNVINDIKCRFGIDLADEKTQSERYIITKIKSVEDIQLGSNNAFIIGEAAGLVLPDSGEGLTSAFESAGHVADAILDSGSADKNKLYAESMLPRIGILERDLNRDI